MKESIENIKSKLKETGFKITPQRRAILEILLENDDKTFAEASPYDKIWGIGLAETDPNSTNPEKWIGENRLGKCLNKLINMVNKTEL